MHILHKLLPTRAWQYILESGKKGKVKMRECVVQYACTWCSQLLASYRWSVADFLILPTILPFMVAYWHCILQHPETSSAAVEKRPGPAIQGDEQELHSEKMDGKNQSDDKVKISCYFESHDVRLNENSGN
jgi:hypothetical protein